jgi:hypothetical protein
MTMKDVYDLDNKDTGDAAGDTSFVISKKNAGYTCQKYPDAFGCIDLPPFSGDDPDSTDLVLEMQIEIDGKWGPYLECNPVNYSDPYGPWACLTHIKHAQPDNYPEECALWDGYNFYCVHDSPR